MEGRRRFADPRTTSTVTVTRASYRLSGVTDPLYFHPEHVRNKVEHPRQTSREKTRLMHSGHQLICRLLARCHERRVMAARHRPGRPRARDGDLADLYIAFGISGARQRIAGATGAKRILVINSDAEAPILASVGHVVIGDLHEIVSAISAERRNMRG